MMAWLMALKTRTLIFLGILMFIIVQVVLAMIANTLPEKTLTQLPYTWYVLLFRCGCYALVLWWFKPRLSNPVLGIFVVMFVLYECYLLSLYQSAMEGQLW